MKRFRCSCGAGVYFDNSQCVTCTRLLGFDPVTLNVLSLEPSADQAVWVTGDPNDHNRYHLCTNRTKHCNWLTSGYTEGPYCLSCSLTQTIPNLSHARNQRRWGRLEKAKRRLLYSLLSIKLPVNSSNLEFVFLEDKKANPLVREMTVYTGHDDGVITINVAEADPVARAAIRRAMGETYRTLIGHFRHESGHYYWPIIIKTANALAECRRLFGDDRLDYAEGLARHYENGPPDNWQDNHITTYASAHPQEDWAETWAHFLHISDALETAAAANWIPTNIQNSENWLAQWDEVVIRLNEMNRSLGLPDAYPFTLRPNVVEKLEFIRQQAELFSAQH